jgi:hypothetical protein
MSFVHKYKHTAQFRSRNWTDEEGGHCTVTLIVRGYTLEEVAVLFMELGGAPHTELKRLAGSGDVFSFTQNDDTWYTPTQSYQIARDYVCNKLNLRIESESLEVGDGGVLTKASRLRQDEDLDFYATPMEPLVLEMREAMAERDRFEKTLADLVMVVRRMRKR